MKIKRKLLLSYLLIIALFVAAGATITYDSTKMADLQNNVKKQMEINNNAYAFQSGLDQKQFGTLMYSTDNTAQGEQIIVNSANIMVPAESFLQTALASDVALSGEFNQVVQLDSNQINGAISQVYSIYISNDTNKYEDIWGQLTTLMSAVAQADNKLSDVRNATLANVETATKEAQNYANFSLAVAVSFIAAI